MEPKSYEIINFENSFHLNAGESLTLLFKYLTFTPVSGKFVGPYDQKLINVSIVKVDSNWIAGGFSLTVELH